MHPVRAQSPADTLCRGELENSAPAEHSGRGSGSALHSAASDSWNGSQLTMVSGGEAHTNSRGAGLDAAAACRAECSECEKCTLGRPGASAAGGRAAARMTGTPEAPVISALMVYPVKGCAAFEPQSPWPVTADGAH